MFCHLFWLWGDTTIENNNDIDTRTIVNRCTTKLRFRRAVWPKWRQVPFSNHSPSPTPPMHLLSLRRDNDVCAAYSPITWQVDRKCHMISASLFDKMCADMKLQADDMSDDLYAHGARELVSKELSAPQVEV